jgi:Response regulator containing CheY-like receiver domain and AraC-type DNA-binding domain
MYKLVIADDEEKILEGIANLFPWQQIGFQVVGRFTNGKEVLLYLEKNQVDVILSDIEMPFMDGITLIKELSKYNGIKIVLFSSYQNYEYFRSAIQFQVFDYLLKPINFNELITCFERLKDELDRDGCVKTELPKSYYNQIVANVTSYLKENYKNASLEDAALRVNMSPSYLSKIYKEKSGVSFSDKLLEIRMEKACEFLRDIKFKSYEIADYVGYDNPTNFSRAFKAYYNLTPKEYRNRNLGGESI